MSLLTRIRAALAGPEVDADGWYTRGGALEVDPDWALAELDDAAWTEMERRRACERLGTALPCARWRRGAEHDPHAWDNGGTVAQCPGWRGEP